MEEILSVEHLSVSFTQYKKIWKKVTLPVIRDLSLRINKGEIVAVVGSSGSGKSLLAHAILGLLPKNASWQGKIIYKGNEIQKNEWNTLRGKEIALVPQSVSYLDPLMKIGEQIRNGRTDSASREKSRQKLSQYGLKEETQLLYPFALSGGMTRRILISAAVMEQPALIIADEPTPGLHLEAAKRVLSHFRELADTGAGILLITHDLELAAKTADRIVVFYAGTNLEEADALDFQEEKRLRHPYTKALFRAMPENGLQEVNGSQPFIANLPVGCPYGPRCPQFAEKCRQDVPCQRVRGGWVRCFFAE